MNRSLARQRPVLPLLILTALILGACGADVSADGAATPGGADATRSIFVSGSSTVEPITTNVAEKYADENPEFDYTVEGPGTGDGFALFCAGDADVANASRPIKDEEAQACAEGGIEYTEILVAYDGLAVVTSVENEGVRCLSFADLYALVGPESQGLTTWSAADDLVSQLPAGYGRVHAPYPDADLVITAPGEESGTFDSFVELVIGGLADERGQDETTRPDYVASANDNVIIEGISGSPTSLGWVGLAFAREHAERVRALEIDSGSGCVAPSDETVINGQYPIARPLYVYVNNARAAANDALVSFVDFYVDHLDSAGEVGYVDLSADEAAESKAAWEGRQGVGGP